MTNDRLESKSRTTLMRLAKRARIPGFREMTKTQLVASLGRKLGKTKSKPGPSSQRRASARGKQRSGTSNGNGRHRPDRLASIIAAQLRGKSKSELARLAGQAGLADSRSLDKSALIRALVKHRLATLRSGERSHSTRGRLAEARRKKSTNSNTVSERDRVILMVRDAFWLHAYWELTERGLNRVRAALGAEWFHAKPTLRLVDVTSQDATNSSETVVRDIPLHEGVRNWYIDVFNAARSYRVDVGFLTAHGRFYALARSNSVSMPKPGLSQQLDGDWKSLREEYERAYMISGGSEDNPESNELRQVFEERLRRPMTFEGLGKYGPGALADHGRNGFHFEIDAELIVYGRTDPSAKVTMQSTPVPLRPDGTFTMRFSFPEGRQIIPSTAQTRNGLEERTIILAVERNTKELEPMVHDGQD
jgi:hypothetical protein